MTVLSNKSVLVVGAAGGLGRALCSEMSSHGATLIGTTHVPAKFNELEQFTSSQYLLDLADHTSIDKFLAELPSTGIILSGVVIAAGVVGFANALDTPHASFDMMMAINATGPIRLLTGLAPHLSASESSFIVTLSGQIAETPMAGLSAYSASKSALHAFGVAAGREFRRLGIRWVDARPGHTETGLSSRPLFGVAKDFGAGLSPRAVAQRIVFSIENDERDMASSSFL